MRLESISVKNKNNKPIVIRTSHWLLRSKRFYDFVQTILGRRFINKELETALKMITLDERAIVVDIGGGTGLNHSFFRARNAYFCTDIDFSSLEIAKSNGVCVFSSDATLVPLTKNSVDLVICTFLSHHITDKEFEVMLLEIKRILKPGGKFLFVDAYFDSKNKIGSLLWKFDQGYFPKSRNIIQKLINVTFDSIYDKSFRWLHAYILIVGK